MTTTSIKRLERHLSKLVHLGAVRKPISDARTVTYVILSLSSGPGGRWFKSTRPDHFYHTDLHCDCYVLFNAKNLSRLVNHRLFVGRKYKTDPHLGSALLPPLNVVEQLLAIAPRHSPSACPMQ